MLDLMQLTGNSNGKVVFHNKGDLIDFLIKLIQDDDAFTEIWGLIAKLKVCDLFQAHGKNIGQVDPGPRAFCKLFKLEDGKILSQVQFRYKRHAWYPFNLRNATPDEINTNTDLNFQDKLKQLRRKHGFRPASQREESY